MTEQTPPTGASAVRHRRRRPGGRRQGDHPDEGLGREDVEPRGDRVAGRLRRAVRRLRADPLHPTDPRHLDRRGGHQGRDLPGHGRPRHDRLRPGRHGRRRPRRLWCGAAVHDRLHRLRPGRAGADRGDRQGHRRGVRRGRLLPDRGRDGRAPRADGARRLRHRRRSDGGGRGVPPARPRSSTARRRGRRDGVQRPALQRLLPGPPRPARAGRLGARPRRGRARPHPRRGAARADPDLHQGVPRARRRDRRPRDGAHHRRRPRREPAHG